MTKSSTAWAVATGTVVTVCVAGGGLVGLTRALEPQPTSTSTLTTSHGVMTKSTNGVTTESTEPRVPTSPAPPAADPITSSPRGTSDPTIVPPAAPKILDASAPDRLKWAADRWAHNGDTHHWMHQRTRTDDDARTRSGDLTPDSWITPSTEAPPETPAPTLRMAPTQQQTDQQSQDQYRAPGPRHRADDRGADGGYFGGHQDGGSHGRHR